MSEKPSLSIVCNELDYHIHLYDQGQIEDASDLQKALNHFVQILEENADQGIPPQEVIHLISTHSANDIETFLYDFISEQIDVGNEAYVNELIDDFDLYLENNKWFKLLRIRLCDQYHGKIGQKLIEVVVEEHLNDQDLDYNLELLSILVEKGNDLLFRELAQKTFPLITSEESFQDLLSIAIDYFHFLDYEKQEAALKTIFQKHTQYPIDKIITSQDPDLIILKENLKR